MTILLNTGGLLARAYNRPPPGPQRIYKDFFMSILKAGLDRSPFADVIAFRRSWRVGLHHAGLGEGGADLLHFVDELDGGDRLQHQAANRVAPARDRRVWFHVVHAGDGEFQAQGLAVERQATDAVGESL